MDTADYSEGKNEGEGFAKNADSDGYPTGFLEMRRKEIGRAHV